MQFDIGLKGIVKVTVTESDGSVVSSRVIDNIETNYALNAMAKWLSGTPNTGVGAILPPTRIGAGNGTGVIAATDTALWSPIATTQRLCDSIMFTQNYYAQFNLTYQTSDPVDYYNELGLFDTNGNMWAHVAINQYKTLSQTLSIQWMIFSTSDNSGGASVSNYTRATLSKWISGTSNVSGQAGAVIPPNQFRLGVGTGQVSGNDTALFSEKAGSAKTCSAITIVQSTKVQFAVIYVDGDPSGQFNECGLFDTLGNIWVHGLINANRQVGYIMSTLSQISIAQG